MDDQSRNLILATALSFLVLLGWFVLGPILFPSAFPPPPRRARRPPETAQDGDDATPAARPPAPPPAPETAAAASRRRARRRWRRPRGCRSGPPASRARCRWSAAASTTSRSPTTRVTVEPGSPIVTLLHPAGRRARLLRAATAGRPRAPLDRRRGARPRHALDGRERRGADRDDAGDAALGQRPGPRSSARPSPSTRTTCSPSPSRSRTRPARRCGSAPTASSPATGCRPISRTSTSCTKASSP